MANQSEILCNLYFQSLTLLILALASPLALCDRRPQQQQQQQQRFQYGQQQQQQQQNAIFDEEGEAGPIDFSEAEEQEDGSLCVTKTKYYEKFEKQQVGGFLVFCLSREIENG